MRWQRGSARAEGSEKEKVIFFYTSFPSFDRRFLHAMWRHMAYVNRYSTKWLSVCMWVWMCACVLVASKLHICNFAKVWFVSTHTCMRTYARCFRPSFRLFESKINNNKKIKAYLFAILKDFHKVAHENWWSGASDGWTASAHTLTNTLSYSHS